MSPYVSPQPFVAKLEPLYSPYLNGKTEYTGHLLELHGVSYIRSFTTGRWYSRLFNPPITAQFLKDVNLQLQAGEILGIAGASGSGKTTLLNVIARRVQGTTGGTILLNHRPLTERLFQDSCGYVCFKQSLFAELTVAECLYYQAELTLSATVTRRERDDRVNHLMQDFELATLQSVRVEKLDESSRRRLLIAMQLVRDPVLLLVDEPTRGLDFLAAYQIVHLLSTYMKRYQRMTVLSLVAPRSDVYPLLDRICMLFFGEVIFSGYTKHLLRYFRHIGFPCPASENPAVYFLSLATVDRETSERYLETQDQAVKLIEIFKADGHSYVRHNMPAADGLFTIGSYLPLAQLGRPNAVVKFLTLVRRHWVTAVKNGNLFARLFLPPLFAVLLFLFYFHLSDNDRWSPWTRAGLVFNAAAGIALVSAVLPASIFEPHRTRYYQDSWENVYGGFVFILSHLNSFAAVDALAVFGYAAVLFWPCNLGAGAEAYLKFASVLYCCAQFAQMHTYCLMSFIRSPYKAACVSLVFLVLHLVSAFGFLKSIMLYKVALHSEELADKVDWLYYLTYASIFRFAGAHLQFEQLGDFNVTECLNALRPGATPLLCRWETGNQYLREVYRPEDYDRPWENFGVCFAFMAAMWLLTVVVYTLPMPYAVKRKFRFKAS